MTVDPADRTAELLSRTLGPAGPELSCDDCFEHLDRYVELELSGQDPERSIPGMTTHLEGCPACRDDHSALRDYVREHDP